MAPFKLKFRMGSSRSSSQEADTEQTTQHLLLNNVTSSMSRSNTTINSEQTVDTGSYGSLNNDEYALILNNKSVTPIGYTNPTLTDNILDEGCGSSKIKKTNSTQCLNTMDDYTIECSSTNDKSTNYTKSLDTRSNSCSTMTTPSHENLMECTGSCDLLFDDQSDDEEPSSGNHETYEENECSVPDEKTTDEPYEDQLNENQSNDEQNVQEINEIIDNKSSKEIYKDYAKQWGIACKMSDQCRCLDCQGHYFDCEFDDNEHQKTDGGLGAGTPMFISEVMHGTACNIL